jgi:hypothetical protein
MRSSQIAVLDLFRRHGPMTDERLVAAADLDGVQQSVSGLRTRRSELVTFGLLIDSGDRGITVSRRPSIIWRLDENAVAAFDAQAGDAPVLPLSTGH